MEKLINWIYKTKLRHFASLFICGVILSETIIMINRHSLIFSFIIKK